MKKQLGKIYLILTFLLGFLIFYFSVIPGKVIETGFRGFDKIEHFAAYFLLSLLTYKTIKSARLAFFLAGTYGLLMEAIQFTLPYRYFSLGDIAINYIAAFLIILFSSKS